MIRHIDDLGRLVLPKEWRTKLKLNAGDDVNMELDCDKIIITNPNLKDEFEDLLVRLVNKNTGDNKILLEDILESYRTLKK